VRFGADGQGCARYRRAAAAARRSRRWATSWRARATCPQTAAAAVRCSCRRAPVLGAAGVRRIWLRACTGFLHASTVWSLRPQQQCARSQSGAGGTPLVWQLAGAAAGACQYGHASAARCDPWHERACPCAAQALLASRDGSSNSLSSLGLAGGSHPNLAAAGSLGLPRGGAGAGVGVGHGGAGGSPARTQSSASLGSAGGLLGTGSQHLSASLLLAVQARPAQDARAASARASGSGGTWLDGPGSSFLLTGVYASAVLWQRKMLHVLMLP